MFVGVVLLCRFAKEAVRVMEDCDIEIVEAHHNRKVDAPSGTALMLADKIKKVQTDAKYVLGRSGEHKRQPEEIGIHALRMGSVVGEHQVIFTTNNQSLTLCHFAQDRSLYSDRKSVV